MARQITEPVEGITARQREVARLIAEGRTNPEIADALGITLAGAKYHVSELLGRLGLERREEIAAWYCGGDAASLRARMRAILAAPLAWGAGAAAVVAVAVGALMFDATEVETIAEAQALATFDVRTPTGVPERFELFAMTHQRWPFGKKGVHADFVLVRYRAAEGGWLEIWQGFAAPYLSFQSLAPEGYAGLLTVDGQEAVWIQGRPAEHDGGWDPAAQLALGIFEGLHGDGHPPSPQYTVLASSDLTLDELIAIARSFE